MAGKPKITFPGKLSFKQARFIEEYLKDGNAAQSAIRAGYPKGTAKEVGYENLTKPHIKKRIDAALARRAAMNSLKQTVDASYVLDRAVQAHEQCMKKGKSYYPAAGLKALELVGRHIAVNAFVRDEQHLHVTINGITDRLSQARLRVIEPSSDRLIGESEDEKKVG